MTTVTVTSQIDAPVKKTFMMFTDIEHVTQHVTGIKEVQVMTPGGFGLGTRWLETREVLGRLDSAEMEVTAFEKNRTYTITHHKAGAKIDTVFAFQPSGTGTKVSIEFGLENQGLPPGLLTPVSWAIAGKVREVLGNDLADMKRTVEKS
ncbi:MAG: hypothetical protein FJW27_14525 [Acidimicrobiia bacterium]|nr:hypothetical protein [Acidimicrobiia bacterium]